MKFQSKYLFAAAAVTFATGIFIFQNCARLQYDDNQAEKSFFAYQVLPSSQAGPLSVLGVTGANENQIDSYLVGSNRPIFHWTRSIGADHYTVVVRSGSSTVCSESAGNQIDFAMVQCDLSFGDYEVLVTATSGMGTNSTSQTSDPFLFHLDPNGIRLTIQAPTIRLHQAHVPYSIENPSSVKNLTCSLQGSGSFSTQSSDCTAVLSQDFPNLDYGSYVFQISLTDQDGHSSTRQLAFEVLSPNCDPLSGVGKKVQTGLAGDDVCEQRIKANVYFHTNSSGNPIWNSVDQYIREGINSGTIYFSNVFIPTRSFTSGFPGISERTEFFGFDMLTKLKVSSHLPVGNYQFALIADDGAKLSYFNSEHSEILIIDNDGYHPTRVLQSTVPVILTAKDRITMRIRYFQGPRDAISLVLLYRPWDSKDKKSISSGFTSQDLFGSFPVPARGQTEFPGTDYDRMVQDGWKPVPVESFENPDI